MQSDFSYIDHTYGGIYNYILFMYGIVAEASCAISSLYIFSYICIQFSNIFKL